MRALLIYAVNILYNILEITIIGEVIISWVPNLRSSEIGSFLHNINEPLMRPGRYLQNLILPNLMIDFSPIIAFLIIGAVRRILLRIIIWI